MVFPLILSASRATDIPAFHARWFMERLRQGHCPWTNPFNNGQRQTVSFAHCRFVVFWSKNPAPLEPYLAEVEERGLNFCIQYTLNDYENEGLEPGLPPLSERLDAFMRLSGKVGRERVVWRFDPVILGNSLPLEAVLERIDRMGRVLAPYTEKLVFSFLDMYRKTRCALRGIDPSLREPTAGEMEAFAAGLARLKEQWGVPLRLAACAEEADLTLWGIEKNACVDGELVRRLCPHDADVQAALGAPGKHAGQRRHCGCAPSKDIGVYGTCGYACAYCYAAGRRQSLPV